MLTYHNVMDRTNVKVGDTIVERKSRPRRFVVVGHSPIGSGDTLYVRRLRNGKPGEQGTVFAQDFSSYFVLAND